MSVFSCPKPSLIRLTRPLPMPSLHFKGKTFVQNHHLAVPFHALTPVKSMGTSKTASLHDTLKMRSIISPA